MCKDRADWRSEAPAGSLVLMEKHLDGWLAHKEELSSTICDSDDDTTDHLARVVAGATAQKVDAKEGVESQCASSAAASRRGLELARIAG